MATLVWAVICQRILHDQNTNFLSYIDAMDGVALPTFPVVAPMLFVGTLWQLKDDPKFGVRVCAYAPDGSLLLESNPFIPEIPLEQKRYRVNVGLTGLPLSGPGLYTFGVENLVNDQWVEVTRIPFDVEQAVGH